MIVCVERTGVLNRGRKLAQLFRYEFMLHFRDDLPWSERRMHETRIRLANAWLERSVPVSYTHLTLPTIYSV